MTLRTRHAEPKKLSATNEERSSRFAGFYRLTVEERQRALVQAGWLSPERAQHLKTSPAKLAVAESMIENVIGVLEMPIGLGLNFTINDRDYVIPMVVEEPSIVAAVSHAAKIVRASGGFQAECDESIMIGQLQIVGCHDPEEARSSLLRQREELIALANSFEPGMKRRGGGAMDLEVRILRDPQRPTSRYGTMVVVHLLIHTCDAMGANMINTMVEGIAPRVEELTGGSVHLRILSNLADRRRVRASCRIPFSELATETHAGRSVAEGIELASRFAELDPHRAATHNKGVMNGIDAVAIATGNDWRAIEAGAHAWCCRNGRYEPMTTWRVEAEALVGALEIPMQVGTVGGPIRLHPTIQTLVQLLGVDSAHDLACVLGSVGLAQNFSALKALATVGIQKGHMALHARSMAATAGAEPHEVEQIAAEMIATGDIKVERARKLLALRRTPRE